MFEIHPQLQKDCHILGKLDLCHVLLHRNAQIPWFILVPETHVENLLDLDSDSLQRVMLSAQKVSLIITNDLKYTKTNMGSLGNVVSQLHIHIIGRHPNDPCWPQPVWGNLTQQTTYTDRELNNMTNYLNKV